MNATAPSIRDLRLGLPVRVAILAALFVSEKIFLNRFVDFDAAQNASGLGALLRVSQHWGFRFLVALAAAVALFAFVRGGQRLRGAQAALQAAPMRAGWMLLHLLLIAALAPLSFVLYRYTATDLVVGSIAGLWMATALAAAAAALWSMAPGRLWWNAARAAGMAWAYALLAALLGTAAMQLTQGLWAPTTALTFDLVRGLLTPLLPALVADPATGVLSTGRFAIQVADVCSGLEGVGLILAFSSAWLLYFRREYAFPRALLLIPASVATIFALNVLRITALVMIGDAGFPDVAVYGFHSQAGWIAFNAVACGLVLISRRSGWFHRAPVPPAEVPGAAAPATAGAPLVSASATHNPTAAYLMPLLAILAAGALSRALSSDFEYLYPLRVIAGIWMLLRYRHRLATLDWHWSWRGPACGALVFLLWVAFAHFQLQPSAVPAKLASLPAAPRLLWIIARLTGGVLLVPIAEELAYRGYLMRRLSTADFDKLPLTAVRWPALAASALLFGLAHGTLWLPGAAAGLAFGWIVIRRGHLGEAVLAHLTTNALIAAGVLVFDQWQLW